MKHTAVIICAAGVQFGASALATQLFGKPAGFCYLVGFVVGVVLGTLLLVRGRE